jgi:hypothetical protein
MREEGDRRLPLDHALREVQLGQQVVVLYGKFHQKFSVMLDECTASMNAERGRGETMQFSNVQRYLGEVLCCLESRRACPCGPLADKLDFSPSFISQVENGQVSPSIPSAFRAGPIDHPRELGSDRVVLLVATV